MFVDSSPMRPKPLPPSSSGQPPKLIDLLAPVTDFNIPPVDYRPNYQLPVQREMLPTPPAAMDDEDDDFDEEIIRQPQPQGTPEQWALPSPSPDCYRTGAPYVVSRVCALVSGGLDSGVLLANLLRDGSTVQPIYVRAGMAWEGVERRWLVRSNRRCRRA